MGNNFQYQRLSLLANLGFSPRTILDIGAYQGEWTKMAHQIFPLAKIFMIEATPDNESLLRNVSEASGLSMALLGNKSKKSVDFYVANPQTTSITTGNSIYMEKTRYFDNQHLIKLPMTTLDEMVAKRKLKNIDFIKIDTQGSELNILKGGKKTVSKAEFILLETQNLEYNDKAPFTEDVVIAMKSYGLRLFDILETHYLSSGELFQVDLLFAKKDSMFMKKGRLI